MTTPTTRAQMTRADMTLALTRCEWALNHIRRQSMTATARAALACLAFNHRDTGIWTHAEIATQTGMNAANAAKAISKLMELDLVSVTALDNGAVQIALHHPAPPADERETEQPDAGPQIEYLPMPDPNPMAPPWPPRAVVESPARTYMEAVHRTWAERLTAWAFATPEAERFCRTRLEIMREGLAELVAANPGQIPVVPEEPPPPPPERQPDPPPDLNTAKPAAGEPGYQSAEAIDNRIREIDKLLALPTVTEEQERKTAKAGGVLEGITDKRRTDLEAQKTELLGKLADVEEGTEDENE